MLLYSSDLVHTTESLRSAKLSAGKTEKECSNLDAILEPYKTENAQLTRENNELHLEILKMKEQSDHHVKGNIRIIMYFFKFFHATIKLQPNPWSAYSFICCL